MAASSSMHTGSPRPLQALEKLMSVDFDKKAEKHKDPSTGSLSFFYAEKFFCKTMRALEIYLDSGQTLSVDLAKKVKAKIYLLSAQLHNEEQGKISIDKFKVQRERLRIVDIAPVIKNGCGTFTIKHVIPSVCNFVENYDPKSTPEAQWLRINGTPYRVVMGSVSNFSQSDIVECGQWVSRPDTAILTVNRDSPLLLKRYQTLKTELDSLKLFSEEDILRYVMRYIRENVFPHRSTDLIGDYRRVTLDFKSTNPSEYLNYDVGRPIKHRVPLIPIDYFIGKGIGVCKHRALVAAYFIDRLTREESPHLSGAIQHIRGFIYSGAAHAWNAFASNTGEKRYLFDAMRGTLDEFSSSTTAMDRLKSYYGPNIIDSMIAQMSKALKAWERYRTPIIPAPTASSSASTSTPPPTTRLRDLRDEFTAFIGNAGLAVKTPSERSADINRFLQSVLPGDRDSLYWNVYMLTPGDKPGDNWGGRNVGLNLDILNEALIRILTPITLWDLYPFSEAVLSSEAFRNSTPDDRTAMINALLELLPSKERDKVHYQIFVTSPGHKSGPNWGAINAGSDLAVLKLAIDTVRAERPPEAAPSKEQVLRLVKSSAFGRLTPAQRSVLLSSIFSAFPQTFRDILYWNVYNDAKTSGLPTVGANWGERNVGLDLTTLPKNIEKAYAEG